MSALGRKRTFQASAASPCDDCGFTNPGVRVIEQYAFESISRDGGSNCFNHSDAVGEAHRPGVGHLDSTCRCVDMDVDVHVININRVCVDCTGVRQATQCLLMRRKQ